MLKGYKAGLLSAVTLLAVAAGTISADARSLREGSKDVAAVKELQTLLNAKGANIPVDGKFGQQTRSGVMIFQKSAKLKADGVVGPKTWAKLKG